jgi:hypothetical protein
MTLDVAKDEDAVKKKSFKKEVGKIRRLNHTQSDKTRWYG